MADEPHVAEHFDSFETQQHAARLGMWIFLASETLLFAGLFGLYVAYRTLYTHDFLEAAGHNHLALGTINTVVLISSSFTVAWSIHAMEHDRRRTSVLCLAATLGLGLLFLAIKMLEYGLHFREGIYPGGHYAFAEMWNPGAKTFFTLYYFLSGLHALHVVAGMGILGWLLVRVLRCTETPRQHTALELGGLYWHLVDTVWIFLWPMLYLTG